MLILCFFSFSFLYVQDLDLNPSLKNLFWIRTQPCLLEYSVQKILHKFMFVLSLKIQRRYPISFVEINFMCLACRIGNRNTFCGATKPTKKDKRKTNIFHLKLSLLIRFLKSINLWKINFACDWYQSIVHNKFLKVSFFNIKCKINVLVCLQGKRRADIQRRLQPL